MDTLITATVATYDFGTEFADNRRAETAEQRAETAAALADPDYSLWLAENADGIVGVAEIGPGPLRWELEEIDAPPPLLDRQLIKLYVLAPARGAGIGQALLDASLGDLPAYLWVFAVNTGAVGFYRRNGFLDEGLSVPSGPSWGDSELRRMIRPGRSATV